LGDGGPATSAVLTPQGLAFDPSTGNIYIADYNNGRVRVVTPDGNINTVAGGGSSTAENVPPLTESLDGPSTVGLEGAGSVYVNNDGTRIMQIANGNIATFAGGLTVGSSGDNGPATSALLWGPTGIAADSNGNVYISDSGNNRVRKVYGGDITTFAGGGTGGLGDQGPATSASFSTPAGLAIDSVGNLYIADQQNNRIRKVITQAGPAQGTITTVAGGGTGGDGGPATSASLSYPFGVAFDPAGNMFVAENNDIRKVSLDGTISTVAGSSYNYDYSPSGITADLGGNVYFSGSYDHVVFKLTPVSAFCTYTLSPVTTQPNTGGPLSINVTAATGCNWSASSDASWATISSGATGTGNGTVQLTLTSNSTSQPRTGNINIAGQAVTLTQNGNQPSLTVAMMHNGSFRQGQQNANYFVVVSNAATSMPTSAAVVVTEFVPSTLTLVSMSGTGWTCGGNICSRSDALAGGSSYPPITVAVNVAANAPAQVTNEIGVVGGGSTGATAYDPATIASISISLNVAGCYTATVQGEPTHATSWTINPQIGTLEVVPMWIGITPFAGPFDEIDIACYTPSVSGPNSITLTATSEADTGLTASILLNGHTGLPQ
jgi:sugar lactone lactonase YvrE